jgi:DNA-binding NarL/FixJ family response regulator
VITILVVDDHPIVRDGLSALIATADNMTVVAEAGDAEAAIAAARVHRPNVVLMDLHLPGTSGIQATQQITASLPGTKVLVLTMSEDDDSLFAATRAGASGYLLKGATENEILTALETVSGGGAVFGPVVAARILGELGHVAHGDRSQRSEVVFPELTNREREILEWLAIGLTNHAIGRQLGLSTKTVANQLSLIYNKLHVVDRARAMILARDAGLGQNHPLQP